MLVRPRPRRYAWPVVLRLGTPVLTYDPWRQAYRLRLIGNRYGPVLRPNRRHRPVAYDGIDRRGAGGRVRGGKRRELYQIGVLGGVVLGAALIALGLVLLPAGSSGRTDSTGRHAASRAVNRTTTPSVLASERTAPIAPALTPNAQGSVAHHARASATSTHRAPGTRHSRSARVHRHPAASHAPARTAPINRSTTATKAPVGTTSTPVQTRSTPVVTDPPPVHTTPAVHTTPPPVNTTPAPTHTTPAPAHGGSSGGGTGTSQGSDTGTTSSSGSGGSGTVNGGG